MSQARRAVVALISVIAVVLGFAPAAFAQSPAVSMTKTTSQSPTTSSHAAAVASGPGYWLATQNGGIFSAGSAAVHGSAVGVTLAHPIVGIAPTPTRNGYWLVASDGGIFSYGDAAFHGSTGAIVLNQPIVGMAATPSGHGYWMVASDGGIFAFGDAHFYGSTGNITLNKPIVGITSSPTGHGYWMVASDGGIFAFGDAAFHGSTGNIALNQPITGIASTPTGRGYWMVASDGGVFSFGDAHFFGSTGAIVLNQPIVGMAATPTGHGYWFVAADGGVFSFGDAHFLGAGVDGAHAPVVGMAPSASVPATKLMFSTEPGNAAAGSPLSTQPVVTVQTAGGVTATTDASDVTLGITTPGGENFGCDTNPKTSVSGVATFSGCSIDTPGTYTLTASDGSLAAAISTMITITPGATQLAFTTQPSATATGGTAFVRQPVVTVRDAFGATVTTDTSAVTLTLTTPAGATLACIPSTAKAAVAGVAAFTGCNINLNSATPYTLHAADGSLTAATSTGTVVSIGAASQLGFTTQPSASTGGAVFTSQPQIAVQDAGGNPTGAGTGTATLTITTPAGAVLACTTSNARAITAGVAAAFAGCNINLVGTYTLTATNTGGTVGAITGTSATLPITVGTAAAANFSVAPSATAAPATAFGVSPSVTIRDAGGNLIANGGSVVLTLNGGTGALTCTSTTTVATATGVSAFTGCQISLAGTYTLTGTDGAATVNSGNIVVS